MRLSWKKILVLIGFVLIVAVFAFLIYYFFFRPFVKPKPAYVPPETELLPGQLPEVINANLRVDELLNTNTGLPDIGRIIGQPSEVARGGLTKTKRLSSTPVKGAKVASDGSLLYYDEATGKFYRILADGTLTELSGKVFHRVENITWSGQANQAILEYPDGSNILYDFNENKQYTLPKAMQDFSFSANGTKIASEVIGPASENNWLVSANPDGTGIKFIEQIGDESENVLVGWSPNNQVVATFRDSYDADRQEIIFIGQNKENFKSFIPQGRGFEGQWTPDGEKMLYSVYSQNDNFLPKLWITNAQGDSVGTNNISLNLNTWIDKCTVNSSGSSAYCAVPRELPFGSGWYPELAQGVPDDFYYVNLETGHYSLLAVPSGDHSASQVFLSPDEKELYFIDQDNDYLYNISLP